MSGFLNNIALTIENLIGAQLAKGEYRLGTLDLKSLEAIAPLNQKFEALLLRCQQCGDSTAFLSLGSLNNYLDKEKQSQITCRHCQSILQIPKVQQIRTQQGKEFNFLQIQDYQLMKIVSKKGRLVSISKSERHLQFQISNQGEIQTTDIEIPQNKVKLIQTLQVQERYRFKAKVYESKVLNPHSVVLKKTDHGPAPSTTIIKYELVSISKLRP